jgi:hypothetical protein
MPNINLKHGHNKTRERCIGKTFIRTTIFQSIDLVVCMQVYLSLIKFVTQPKIDVSRFRDETYCLMPNINLKHSPNKRRESCNGKTFIQTTIFRAKDMVVCLQVYLSLFIFVTQPKIDVSRFRDEMPNINLKHRKT